MYCPVLQRAFRVAFGEGLIRKHWAGVYSTFRAQKHVSLWKSDLDAGSPHLVFRATGKHLPSWLGPALPLSQTSGLCTRKGWDRT